MTQNTSVSDQDKLMAALAYPIWLIVPLIILLTESKNRPFQRYHAIQSLGVSVAIFVVNIALCLVTFVVALVPFVQVLSPVLGCLSPLVFVVFVGVTLYFAYKAYKGEMFEIPFLTNFLKQQKWL